MAYCIKTLKTGRCAKSKYEDNTSVDCNYNYTTNRCNSTRKKGTTSRLKPKSISMSRPKSLKIKTPVKIEKSKNNTVIYNGYLVESDVKTYLDNLIMKKSGKRIRDMTKKYDLYIPVEDYPNDNDLKRFIIKDLLTLCDNDVRDRTKTNAISLNNVHYIIINDQELLILFGNKYKGFFKFKGSDVILDNNKIREYAMELNKPYRR